MDQPVALLDREKLAPNSAFQWPRKTFEARDLFLQNRHKLSCPPEPGAITYWRTLDGSRGGSVRPWSDAAVLPASLSAQQAAAAQTAQAVENAIAAERNQLARELHDAVTQTLFAASLIAEVLPDLWDMDEGKARESTEKLRQLTRGALAEMRTLLFELRPVALGQARLSDLLKQLSEAVMGRECLPISLEIAGECEIPCDAKLEMYRIVQESLNNIVKYAHATRVEINVQLEANHVHMRIEDNGVGFDRASVKPTSLGLRIMRERAEGIGAELQIASQPGVGTTVILDWPG